jgi:hypothetical protein
MRRLFAAVTVSAAAALCVPAAPAMAWGYAKAGWLALPVELEKGTRTQELVEMRVEPYINAIVEVTNGITHPQYGTCFSVPPSVPDEAIYSIVMQYAARLTPSAKQGPAAMAVTFALQVAFPCR